LSHLLNGVPAGAGQNHLILETDPGWGKFQEEVAAFLAA
jgi:hypothetical protein